MKLNLDGLIIDLSVNETVSLKKLLKLSNNLSLWTEDKQYDNLIFLYCKILDTDTEIELSCDETKLLVDDFEHQRYVHSFDISRNGRKLQALIEKILSNF